MSETMEAVIDQPLNDQVDDQQVTQTDTSQQDTQQTKEPETVEERIDGRTVKIPKEWSQSLKELRELYPDKADMFTRLRDTYGRYGALQELAPKGLDDVKTWKTTIDALGGSEAAAELMTRAASMEQIDSKIAASDFSVVGDLPEDLQKGFYGMIPDALSHLAEADQPAFNAAVAPHFRAALADTGLGAIVDRQIAGLQELYGMVDDPKAKAIISQLFQDGSSTKDWYKRQTEGAPQIGGGTKQESPEMARLRAQVEASNKEKTDGFVKGVTDTTAQHQAKAFADNAAVYIKQRNLTEAQQADLRESYDAKLVNALAGDAAFQKQLKAYGELNKIGKADAATVANFIQAKIDDVSKKIVDDIVIARYGAPTQKKLAANVPATDGGNLRVAKAPDVSEWDRDKMDAAGYENTVKKGIFYLKGNKTVQLARAN